ncbi:glycoside hydrolase family 3 C-terminal domain-containing protein [Mycobacterium sp. pW049]|uniref:glycoside hydrolase family 3 C-terminal domain-containing protein n=1 Tax=[Mycobacterium] bulgaricum TaxID=3238985 RepID=UPI00351B33AB
MPTTEQLTLEEKAALLCGRDFWSTTPIERVGVPSIVLTDGPHGVRLQEGSPDHLGLHDSRPATCFPPAVAVGSSWNPAVAERVGSAVGRQARALGVHVALGPGVNIKRSPLCGRNFEYYSEDPLLTGVLAAAHVRGQQAHGVGASMKHFAANNQETDRMRVSADVDERTLREIYFPAFERVVTDARPATVMCSYNRINGVHASENRWLLTDVLREQWGFTGAVVSDWGAVRDPVAALRSGLDLQMPGTGGAGARRIVEAVQAGELDESAVDAAVDRVSTLTRLAAASGGELDLGADHTLARELATECAVLLKNDHDTLPLAAGARIAVVGEFARTPRFQGGGSSHINATQVDAALDAIRELCSGSVAFAPGFSTDGSGEAAEMVDDAVAISRRADVTVVFAGLAEQDESEGFDRDGIALPDNQIALIRAVAAVAPRTVVVLSNGGVVSLEPWHDDVDAILEGFLLGEAGGGALADLLFGVANPSGRLAETIPMRLADTASHVNFPGELGHVRYGEGVMVGYRWHETVGLPARYPFGHGLSYSTFDVGGLSVEVTGDDTARVSVTVTNAGGRAGSHVVQVYVSTSAGPVRRPRRELRAFAKLHLGAGETRTATMELDRRAFAYWNVDRAGWVVAPGEYTVQVCENAATVTLQESVTLHGDHLVDALTMESTVEQWFTHPVAGPALLAEFAAGADAAEQAPDMLRMVGSIPMRTIVAMLGDAAPVAKLEEMMELSRREADRRTSLA